MSLLLPAPPPLSVDKLIELVRPGFDKELANLHHGIENNKWSLVEPFARTYAWVTLLMRHHASTLPADTDQKKWLETLIEKFQAEYRDWFKDIAWDSKPDLEEYVVEWSKLDYLCHRLVAGAFLHISYDLPRVLATYWPDASSEQKRTTLYLELSEYFPGVMNEVEKDGQVMGRLTTAAWFFKKTTRDLTDILSHWLLHFRSVAWIHARVLTIHPDRHTLEGHMLKGMKLALRDTVQKYEKKWILTTLLAISPIKPPSITAPTTLLAITIPEFYISDRWIGAGGTALLVLIVLAILILRERLRRNVARRFVNEFGRNVLKYTNLAITNPGELDRTRERS